MNIEEKIIGVIGFGNFGKVICEFLFPKNSIVLYTTKSIKPAKRISIVSSLEDLVSQADIIIPAVPIRNFKETIKTISHSIKPHTVVMDVCSVKEYPVTIMQQYLPSSDLIASHPMFGPNSIAKKGAMKNFKLVLHNISAEKSTYEEIKNNFQNLALNIIEITPKDHDMLTANSQFFALVVAEIARQHDLSPTIIDTPGATTLFDATSYIGTNRHIIEDMIVYNRYCKSLLEKMIVSLHDLERTL